MKKWTGLLLLLLVLFLIAYFIVGFIVQSTLNKNVNSIPQSSILSVHLDNYQRGWLSSQAVLSINMNVPEQETKDENGVSKLRPPVHFELSYPLIIKHGPIIFTDYGIRFGLGYVTTRPETHYHVLVNYLNETWFRYTFPSLSFKGNSGPASLELSWQGVTATLGISPALDKIFGDFTLYGFNGTAHDFTFQIGEILENFSLINVHDGLWLGKIHITLNSASMVQANQILFDLDGFDLVTGSDITEGLLSFDFSLSLNKLQVSSKTYGPGNIKLTLKNLDADAMTSIDQGVWYSMQNNQNSALLVPELLSNIPKLFSKGVELELSERCNLPEGNMTGSFKLSLPQSGINAPTQLLQKAYGTGQFSAPMSVVKELMVSLMKKNLNNQQGVNTQTPSTTSVISAPSVSAVTNSDNDPQKQVDKILQNLVNKGFIKVEGNNYITNIKLEKQQIFLNNQLFDSNALQ